MCSIGMTRAESPEPNKQQRQRGDENCRNVPAADDEECENY